MAWSTRRPALLLTLALLPLGAATGTGCGPVQYTTAHAVDVGSAPFEGGAVPRQLFVGVSPPAAPAPRAESVSEDPRTYRVPIGSSPVLGKATALVTLVEFSDFQCPFCARVKPTLAELRVRYGNQLRMVFKHMPLPFHPRAIPAAELTLEARAQRGEAGFWKVHDLLFQRTTERTGLDDGALEEIARAAGLNVPLAMKNIAAQKYQPTIDDDLDLGDDVQASGTPHFFINGRRIVGAQPVANFVALIDEQLALAKSMVAHGIAPEKVYETLLQGAAPSEPFETVALPAPTRAHPSKGPANAKVVVQIFSDFECPYCERVEHSLAQLEAAFPGQLRFVWHNFPLDFHKNAEVTAEAAMEAFAQKGNDGFWKMHAAIFAPDAVLTRASLEQMAKAIGLDMVRFGAALDRHVHRPEIEADLELARRVGFRSTPSIAVNGYRLSGALPVSKFSKAVRLAMGAK